MPTNTSDTTENEQDRGISAAEAAELRRQLADATSRASAAERTAATERGARRQAELASMSHEERLIATQQDACDNEIAALESEADGLTNQIAALADEPGHGKEIAELTRKLGRAEAKLESASGRKEYLAAERERVTGKNKQAREAAERDDGDASDQKLPNGSRLSQYGAATQRWMQEHPRIFSDPQYFARAVRYATEATDDLGIKDQSPEYFRHIEQKLGEISGTGRQAASEDEGDGDEEGEEIATGGRQSEERYAPERPQHGAAGPGSMSAAPPSRRTPQPGQGNGGKTVKARLSAEEKEVADSLYAHMKNPADRYTHYAENKAIMSGNPQQHFTRH